MGSGGSSQRRGLKFITLLKSRGGKGFSRGGEYPPSPPPPALYTKNESLVCNSLHKFGQDFFGTYTTTVQLEVSLSLVWGSLRLAPIMPIRYKS